MGIELKGWYVLAKEREPSFRQKVTPAACSPWTGNRNITPPEAITHYPIKRDMIQTALNGIWVATSDASPALMR